VKCRRQEQQIIQSNDQIMEEICRAGAANLLDIMESRVWQ
jgi:hypothetical protein